MTVVEGSSDGPALEVSGVTKSFGPNTVLSDFSLSVPAGEIHALLGENGSGKSTFIKVLAGYHQPDEGTAASFGRTIELGSADSAAAAGCRFVHQDLGLVATSSIEDNLHLTSGFPTRFGTVNGRALRRSARADLARLGLDLDPRTLVANLTPAQRTSVALARSLRTDEATPLSFVVFDEPTATLPESEVVHLLRLVRQVAAQGVGVLYVTHRLDEIFGFADRVTVLRDGKKVVTEAVSGLSHRDVVNLLVGTEFEEAHARSEQSHAAGAAVLVADRVTAGAVAGVSFTASKGEILGVAGITGSGRETILSCIFGGSPREDGSVTVDGCEVPSGRPDKAARMRVAYLPPDRKTLGAILELSARENLTLADVPRLWRFPSFKKKAERSETDGWFKRLDVRPSSGMERKLATFSGGNQQKVLLAKWLRVSPSVLLLDEPTQGVDIGAKAIIYQNLIAAAEEGAVVVISSSDVDELAAICHRILVLRSGKLVTELTGDAITAKNISRECLGSKLESTS